MSKKSLMVPFDKNGNMFNFTHYDESEYEIYSDNEYIQSTKPTWKEAQDFEDELMLVGYQKGRSAAKVILQSTLTGQKYYMTLKDFCDYLQYDKIVLKDKFAFCKKGQNYSIKKASGK